MAVEHRPPPRDVRAARETSRLYFAISWGKWSAFSSKFPLVRRCVVSSYLCRLHTHGRDRAYIFGRYTFGCPPKTRYSWSGVAACLFSSKFPLVRGDASSPATYVHTHGRDRAYIMGDICAFGYSHVLRCGRVEVE